MASRDQAASIQGVRIRVTPLMEDGFVDPTKPVLTTTGFISASFAPDFEDGDEITEKAADGSICIQYKVSDSLKGITFNLSLCAPEPEAAALLAGGGVLMDADGAVVGYTSPGVGDPVGNPVAVEIWSRAIINGKPAASMPFWHWAFPFVRVRFDGDREFTNGALANEFSGIGVGNDALCGVGLGGPAASYSTAKYAGALKNPFSYVRTDFLPEVGWSLAGHAKGPGDVAEGDPCVPDEGSGGPGGLEPANPIGVTAGSPGAWLAAPDTSLIVPTDVTDAQALVAGAPGNGFVVPTAAWDEGDFVWTLSGARIHWDNVGGDFAAGEAP